MNDMKYVIVEKFGIEMPIVFASFIEHGEVLNGKAISAGFCRIKSKDGSVAVSVFGGSNSLHVNSRVEDAAIIKSFLEYWQKE